MARQDEGWPLGLQPLNVRVGLARIHNFSGSTSFNTLLSGSPSSMSDSSSGLDTESTGSFFPDRSTTLGSLIGVPRIVNLPRRSIRGDSSNRESIGAQKNSRPNKAWRFSLCPTNTTDAESARRNAPSLGHFLEAERRAAANEHRRSHGSSVFYGADDQLAEPNSLFVNGVAAPPPSLPHSGNVNRRQRNIELEQGGGQGVPVMQFPCMCG